VAALTLRLPRLAAGRLEIKVVCYSTSQMLSLDFDGTLDDYRLQIDRCLLFHF